jgi:hypothetical protein
MKPPLVKRLGLEISGVPHPVRMAVSMVVALELKHLHHSKGYAGLGSWQQHRAAALSGKRLRWEDYVKREGGVTDATFRNNLQCAQVVMDRLRRSTQPGCAELLELMQQAPSELTAEQRQRMVADIIRLAFAPGETFVKLRREARAPEPAEPAAPTPPPATPCPCAEMPSNLARPERYAPLARLALVALRQRKEAEEMARAVGISRENARRIGEILAGGSLIESPREDARANGAEN